MEINFSKDWNFGKVLEFYEVVFQRNKIWQVTIQTNVSKVANGLQTSHLATSFIIFAFVEIINADYLTSSPSEQQCPPADKPEYAFIGRSNVGKSSLINMLANKTKLAKTSGTPGKTQLINHFIFSGRRDENSPTQQWYVVDLPGYGFAKRSQTMRQQWEKMIRNYLLQRKNLLQVFLLVDSRHTPQKSDLEFAQNLYSNNIPYTIVFTKSDKENQREVSKNLKLFSEALVQHQQWLPAMIISSSIKKTGRNKILTRIGELNENS